MWFANFDDKIKDKVSNSTQDILDIVTTTDASDTQSIIDKITKLPQDEKKSKELFKTMQKTQLAYLKKFDELTREMKEF